MHGLRAVRSGLALAGLLTAIMLATQTQAQSNTAPTVPAGDHRIARLTVGTPLPVGRSLTAANGRYAAILQRDGNLVVKTGNRAIWSTQTKGTHNRVLIGRSGNLVVESGSKVLWQSATQGSGSTTVLTVSNTGALQLRSAQGLVWSSTLGNGCQTNTAAKAMLVSITSQRALMCQGNQQVLITGITTGATASGDGTPTGTWRIQAKYTDTTLHPAAGGSYFVNYWMPYNGDYGVHDAPWQRFSYGSPLYQTAGSHGCIHLPEPTMGWFYQWAPIGTLITVNP